jgi:hypothetical protein
MDKEKKEQIILIVLIPIFLLGLIYMRLQKSSQHQAQGIVEDDIVDEVAVQEIPEPKKAPGPARFVSSEDPFMDMFHLYMYNMQKAKPVEEIPMVMPDFVIQGIVWNTDRPQAIVSGQVIKVGDIIEGLEVLNIAKEGITVDFNGRRILIKK